MVVVCPLMLDKPTNKVNIGTSALVGRWGEERVEKAWHRVNDRGGREVRVLAEDFQGYYLKCAQVARRERERERERESRPVGRLCL